NEPWQRACANFLGEINNNYPKSDRLNFIKRTSWILPRIVRDAPITGARTFYTDANKSGKKMGPKDNTFIRLIQRQDAEDTTMGPV
ncbi:Endogenous retrovirus group K member 19 Pol protein, partial [Lemmus lemmus]